MSYQVLARKWRPQRFDDVIGQRGVTQTLRNAIAGKRIAQSFVFSGPRGVGKTTTARILARALNCEQGPTADPCGVCDACVEIAEGRDIDVFELDAATHTQIDKVRDIIITGLGMAPVRNRYKIFIIDEVHRLSPQAFDALLKSIEEPPPHVVFMMATTEIEKVPATIQSRSQVFELKSLGVKQVADQLRKIADAEHIQVDDAALLLIARAADGSMRDAQSAFDQVIAFASDHIGADDVSTVLGLVRRDLLIEMADAVAREDAPAVFEMAARAVESGSDLRLVVRELARLTRDLLVLTIDPSRVADPEIAADAERQPLLDLSRMFSGEDLMRAFELLTKADSEIRGSSQPRYHLEMALLRWIHLRKLVPLTDLIQSLGPQKDTAQKNTDEHRAIQAGGAWGSRSPASLAGSATRAGAAPARISQSGPIGAASPTPDGALHPSPPQAPSRSATVQAVEARRASATAVAPSDGPHLKAVGPAELKDAFLAEIKRAKTFFHGTVVAQAQRIDLEPDRFVFVFAPQHRALRSQLEQTRAWLEAAASQLAGRRMSVVAAEGIGPAPPAPAPGPAVRGTEPEAPGAPLERQPSLKEQAMADSGVQALLDVFAAEIKEVEEM